MSREIKSQDTWHCTACVLCTLNCGVKVQLTPDGRGIARTKGDEDHPASQGYLCNKASRLNFYQNRDDRLLSPMRRTSDGSYEPIDWDTAISEIAAKLLSVRQRFGGDKVFYYGGGGQGNHLPGGYSTTSMGPLGMKYRSNALAQEKTGEFWVAERMFGAWPHPDFEHAQVAVFLGKNPWQSHGVHRARAMLREISKDPQRTLIVIDPKRTESADLADIHLAVQPGGDAWLLAGMIATIVQEDLLAKDWLAQHADGLEEVIATFGTLDVVDCASKCGIDEQILRSTARTIAHAKTVAVLEDLGVQMNRHSTLVSYLQRLVWTLTGHFGREGTHYTANGLGRFGVGTEMGHSPVLGSLLIGGLVPCNDIVGEVLTDHPDRYRAMFIESSNPVHSLADSPRWREAMRSLECSVVVDIAMTETALQADYVLPATSQFEKAEATFFNFEFPANYFHVRKPLFEAPDGVLDEAEIHMRLAQAMGFVPEGIEEQLLEVLAKSGREGFREAVFSQLAQDPVAMRVAPGLLYRTLGQTLPEGMRNGAALWAICHQFAATNREAVEAAGHSGEGMLLGESLFDALMNGGSGVVFSQETWADVWKRMPGGRANVALSDLLGVASRLNDEAPVSGTKDYPFLLSAGERRSFTANTIIRNPGWRRKDAEGAMYINPEDAARLNLGSGSTARLSTQGGAADVLVEVDERMQRGHISIPNGMGLHYPNESGEVVATGVAPNELTWSALKDEYAGTPWHKSVPAQVEAVAG